MRAQVDVSVVVPVFNEEENVGPLLKELVPILKTHYKKFEIIFIDDGSCDGTLKRLKEFKKKYPFLKIIAFRKNFGQSSALEAGFKMARGKVIMAMDGDLQNDPNDIPILVERTKEYDVVSGWRRDRKDPLTKRIPSLFSNWLARKLTSVKLHDFGCTLKAYRREAVKDLRLFGETHRYIPVLLAMKGFTITEVVVNHRARQHGKTKYGWKRLMKGFLDLLFLKFWSGFSSRPLHFFGSIGLAAILASVLIAIYKVVFQFMFLGMRLNVGPLLLMSVMLFLTGILLIMFGFLSEIQIRAYYETRGQTSYQIKEIIE